MGKKLTQLLSSHTFSWCPRAGITLPGPWRSINFVRKQGANAMWCCSDWWQLCGRWRHADRCGSISQLTASAGSPRLPFSLNDNGKAWHCYRTFLFPQILLTVLPWFYLRVQIKAVFCVLSFIQSWLFEYLAFPSWTKRITTLSFYPKLEVIRCFRIIYGFYV